MDGEIEGLDEVLPLAPVQAGILLDLLRGDAPPGAYNGKLQVTLDGPLDRERFIRALEDTAAARDVFRLSFEWEDLKQPIQLMHEAATLPIEFEDWTGRTAGDIDAHIAATQAEGYDLHTPPLSRVLILQTGPETHILVWLMHHIIIDGWSGCVLLDELIARYDGTSPPVPTPFRNVLAWRVSRSPDQIAAERAFYEDALTGMAPPVRPGIAPGTAATEGSPVTFRTLPVDPALDRAIGALAQRLRVTPPVVLSALLAVHLRRYGAGDDVIYGETNAGRPSAVPGVATVVGPLVNTLPVRLSIDPEETISDLVRRAGADAQKRRPFANAALSDVKSWSGLRSGAPLYHVPFVYEGLPPVPLTSASGLSLRDLQMDAPSPDPVALMYFPDARPSLRVYTNPRFHDPDATLAFAREYLALVETAVHAPDLPVSTLTKGLAPTPAPQPGARLDVPPLPQSIADIATRSPDAPAVRCGAESLSYGTLIARANDIASGLHAAGIGPGDVVPIAMTRSVDAVAAMLGVLKSGAAYVMLDLDYPEARLRAMLDVVAARVLVTRHEDEDKVGWCELPRLREATGDAPSVEITGDMPAYILFTSGSQGRPKGVRVTHANLAYSTGVRSEAYGSNPRAFLVLSPLGFDSSVAGLYWALSTGGEVQLSPPGTERDASALADLIARDRPSHMLCLPRLYGLLLDQSAAGDLDALDTVIVAGEPLSGGLITRHRKSGRGRLFNEYGPTEATVWCTIYDTSQHGAGDDVPIGHAIPGTTIAITDPDGAPLPDDTLGEITVAGPGVADGYVGDPVTTARAFSNLDTRPAYRTGDLGVRRPDGIVLYRGRADTQVKIRGHRVEPAEIEAALGALPGLGDAVVLTERGPGGLRLVAHVERGEATRIRSDLTAKLPGYMVPAEICVTPDMPRLPNGKIDRRSLAERPRTVDAPPEPPAPGGFVASRLADIWSSLLGGESIGPDTEFFERGGDSLLAMQAVFAAENAGLPIAPHEIFDHPVLSDLAHHIEAKAATGPPDPDEALLARLNVTGRDTPFLMIHGSPEMCSHLGHALGPTTPLVFKYSRYLRGEPPWPQSVKDMVTSLKPMADDLFGDGPVRIGGYSLGGVLAIELARQMRAERGEDPFLFLIDPSWETGASRMPRTRKAMIRHGSAARARLFDARRSLGRGDRERLRLSAVKNCYRAKLLAYRPRRYDGPVRLATSKDGEALLSPTSWLTETCPHRTDTRLDARHLELQKDRDALFAWTTLLARMLRDAEET